MSDFLSASWVTYVLGTITVGLWIVFFLMLLKMREK